jgi:hypothetical protein
MDHRQPPPDPGVLEEIRWSAAWLSHAQDAFTDGLRAEIVTLIPDLDPGTLDGRVLCERMVQAVLWTALTDSPPHVIADSLRWVGTMNYLDGFPEAQYVNVAHALVRAVHELAGSHWSTSIGSAWISYFLWLQPYLEDGARQAAAQQAAQEAARQAARQATQQAAAWQAAAGPLAGEVDLESVAGLLDEEDVDDQDAGYGQIMVSMTRPHRRDRPPH